MKNVNVPKGDNFEPQAQVRKAKTKTGKVTTESVVKNIMG